MTTGATRALASGKLERFEPQIQLARAHEDARQRIPAGNCLNSRLRPSLLHHTAARVPSDGSSLEGHGRKQRPGHMGRQSRSSSLYASTLAGTNENKGCPSISQNRRRERKGSNECSERLKERPETGLLSRNNSTGCLPLLDRIGGRRSNLSPTNAEPPSDVVVRSSDTGVYAKHKSRRGSRMITIRSLSAAGMGLARGR